MITCVRYENEKGSLHIVDTSIANHNRPGHIEHLCRSKNSVEKTSRRAMFREFKSFELYLNGNNGPLCDACIWTWLEKCDEYDTVTRLSTGGIGGRAH